MKKKVADFSIEYLQLLNESGKGNPPKGLGNKKIVDIYRNMVLARQFDAKLLSLQRQGVIGTFASSKGHEATQVASAMAVTQKDWLFPFYRSHAALVARNYPLHLLLMEKGGDERGMQIPKNQNVFAPNIPVSTQIPHAAGFAWALKKKGKKAVVVCYFGDGATSKGDFHEGLNFAGVFNLPVIFICENNQYAISVPLARQTASKTLAQKAIAYGIRGVKVDGNDIFAVYQATRDARTHALEGKPTLIECETYRLSDHTTADDASKYRTKKELERWKKKDPLIRVQQYLFNAGLWDKKKEKDLLGQIDQQILDAIDRFEKQQAPAPQDMIAYTYAQPIPELKEQEKLWLNTRSSAR